MQEAVSSAFGPSAGAISEAAPTKDKSKEYNKDYWWNASQRAEVIPRMLENTNYLFDQEYVDASPKADFHTDDGDEKAFRIVSIKTSLRRDVEVLSGEHPLFTNIDVSGGKLLGPVSDKTAFEIEKERTDQLTKALKLKKSPDFISFCEFGLPPVKIPAPAAGVKYDLFCPKTEKQIDEAFTQKATEIRDKALRKSKAKDVPFICYGSAHCLTSRYNLGVVSPGGAIENGWEMKSVRTFPFDPVREIIDETIRPGKGPILHKKRFPARRAGECARVPDDNQFRLYRHQFGLICVLICSDVMDMNQFSNIIRLNQDLDMKGIRDRIFMVVVPTYNFSSVLMTACRDLSLFARTNVLVTNARGKRETKPEGKEPQSLPPSEFFFMGRNHDELSATKPNIVKGARLKGDLWILDINLREQNRILNLTKKGVSSS